MQVEQFLLDLHTGQPLTESDYTRCSINTIGLLMMSTCLLETCRGLKETLCKRTVQELLDLHTGQPLTESDYTGCSINTTDLLMMSTCLLETCRGLKEKYYVKELCRNCSTCIPDSHLQRVTIPDAVLIQLTS